MAASAAANRPGENLHGPLGPARLLKAFKARPGPGTTPTRAPAEQAKHQQAADQAATHAAVLVGEFAPPQRHHLLDGLSRTLQRHGGTAAPQGQALGRCAGAPCTAAAEHVASARSARQGPRVQGCPASPPPAGTQGGRSPCTRNSAQHTSAASWMAMRQRPTRSSAFTSSLAPLNTFSRSISCTTAQHKHRRGHMPRHAQQERGPQPDDAGRVPARSPAGAFRQRDLRQRSSRGQWLDNCKTAHLCVQVVSVEALHVEGLGGGLLRSTPTDHKQGVRMLSGHSWQRAVLLAAGE